MQLRHAFGKGSRWHFKQGCRCGECCVAKEASDKRQRERQRKPGAKPRSPLPSTVPPDQRRRASQMRSRYGLELDEYNELLRKQRGCCAICRRSFFGSEKLKACIDHDHASGKVRGVLCDDCNVGLGRFKDDKQLLLAAHNYLVPDLPA